MDLRHRCRSRQIFRGAKDFCPKSPKLARKTPKKISSCDFGWLFFKSKHVGHHFCSGFQGFCDVFRDFDKISTDFARILRDFAGIFTKSKLLGVRLHPRFLCQWFRSW